MTIGSSKRTLHKLLLIYKVWSVASYSILRLRKHSICMHKMLYLIQFFAVLCTGGCTFVQLVEKQGVLGAVGHCTVYLNASYYMLMEYTVSPFYVHILCTSEKV